MGFFRDKREEERGDVEERIEPALSPLPRGSQEPASVSAPPASQASEAAAAQAVGPAASMPAHNAPTAHPTPHPTPHPVSHPASARTPQPAQPLPPQAFWPAPAYPQQHRAHPVAPTQPHAMPLHAPAPPAPAGYYVPAPAPAGVYAPHFGYPPAGQPVQAVHPAGYPYQPSPASEAPSSGSFAAPGERAAPAPEPEAWTNTAHGRDADRVATAGLSAGEPLQAAPEPAAPATNSAQDKPDADSESASVAASASAPAPGEGLPPSDETEAASAEPRLRRRYRIALRLAAAVVFIGLAWFGAMMLYYTIKFPDPMAAQDEKAPLIRILARDGSLIAQRGEKHPYMPIALIPPHVLDAVVAIEDRRFHEHVGVDFQGLMRAALTNLRAGRYAQGGSTLTQQLAKNMYLSPQRTLMRKLEELSLAIWLELRLSKNEILELYLNQVYFGSGAYGIEAAAQRHFGKSASALSVVEGAIIAGLLKAPSRYSPSNDPATARKRGRVVLRAMHDAGFLSLKELNSALALPVRFKRQRKSIAADETGYAVDFILERMPSLLSSEEGEIIVETSLDLGLQKLAQRTLAETLKRNAKSRDVSQGALVILDDTGGIRAVSGGADFGDSQFNRAVRAERQPGSTFKPFVFLTALENGMTPESVTYDLPLSVKGWSPRNANNAYRGEVTLREALSKSINTVAVRLALDYGPSRVVNVARRAGIRSRMGKEPSLALGTSEVTLLELTGAYVPFANGGRPVEPYVIRRVRNVSGRILYANPASPANPAFQLRNIGAMNDMLNAAMIAGTGRKAALAEHPAAGKTGTSQDFRDAWFIGYTAHMIAGVWLGNDDGRPMKKVSGGSLPAGIWHRVMGEAHASLSPLPLPGTFRPGTRIAPPTGGAFVARTGEAPRKTSPSGSKRDLHHRDAHAMAGQRITIEPPRTFAPAEVPPLPTRTARRQIRPREGISADFIARALGEGTAPPPVKRRPNNRNVAGSGQTGFDTEEIRRRLADTRKRKQQRSAASRPDGGAPYMALGGAKPPAPKSPVPQR